MMCVCFVMCVKSLLCVCTYVFCEWYALCVFDTRVRDMCCIDALNVTCCVYSWYVLCVCVVRIRCVGRSNMWMVIFTVVFCACELNQRLGFLCQNACFFIENIKTSIYICKHIFDVNVISQLIYLYVSGFDFCSIFRTNILVDIYATFIFTLMLSFVLE